MTRASSTFAHARLLVHCWLRMDFFGDAKRETGGALTSTIFSQAFFGLVLAALLFEPNAQTLPYAAANLSLSTLLVGIGALADPQRAMRRRRADTALCLPAPIASATLPFARALHGAFYLALIATGMAIAPAILSYFLQPGGLLRVAAYFGMAIWCAAICAGAIGILLRAAEHRFGRNSALLLAGTLRATLLGGGFLAFALNLRHLDGAVTDLRLPAAEWSIWLWPPYPAARWLADPGDWRAALVLVGAAALLALLHMVVSDVPRPSAARRRSGASRSPVARLEARLAGSRGPLLGATRFVATMLFRSASFRARVLPLLGVPIAMTILAFGDQSQRGERLLLGMTLQFPAIYLPFLIAFLPTAERAHTGWIFKTSIAVTPALAREASLIALTTRILTPVLLLALALACGLGRQPLVPTLAMVAFSWGVAVWLASLQLRALAVMPFSDDDPEQRDGEVGNLIAFGLVAAFAGGAFAMFADHPAVIFLGLATATSAAARLLRSPTHALTA